MFPAAFCAGMTLPLITASLLRRGAGERAIGQVYAVNTAGAIVGVLAAVHLGFGVLGLKGLIIAGRGDRPRPGSGAVACRGRAHAGCGDRIGARRRGCRALRPARRAPHVLRRVPRRQAAARQHAVLQQLHGKTATVSVTGEPVALVDPHQRQGRRLRAHRRRRAGRRRDHDDLCGRAAAVPGARSAAHRQHRLRHRDDDARAPRLADASSAWTRSRSSRRWSQAAGRVPQGQLARVRRPAQPHPLRGCEDLLRRASSARYDVIVSEPSNPWVSGVASCSRPSSTATCAATCATAACSCSGCSSTRSRRRWSPPSSPRSSATSRDYEFWLANSGDMLIVAAHKRQRCPRPTRARSSIRAARRARALPHREPGRPGAAPRRRPRRGHAVLPRPGRGAELRLLPGARDEGAARALHATPRRATSRCSRRRRCRCLPLFDARARAQPDPARLTPGERPWSQRAPWIRQAHDRRGSTCAPATERRLRRSMSALASDLVLLRAALVDCTRAAPGGSAGAAARRHRALRLRAPAIRGGGVLLARARRAALRAQLPAAERRWLRLHRAVAGGRAGRHRRSAAEAILEAEPGLARRATRPGPGGCMAGKILTGEGAAAIGAFGEASRAAGPGGARLGAGVPLPRGHAERIVTKIGAA